MQTKILLLGICLVAFISFFEVQGEEVTYGVPPGKTCKQAVSDLTKRQLKRIGECTTKLKFKNGKEKNEKKTCVMKCVLMLEGTLDEQGGPDPIGVMVFVENNFPQENHSKVREVIMSCFETTGGIDVNEPTCKTYDPMIKCAMSGLNLFCS